jgi:hypothetical protein
MMSVRSRSTRTIAVGLLSAGLVAGGVAGSAVAAADSPAKPAVTTTATTPAASITAKAAPTTVASGGRVVFSGHASGLKSGATVKLERKVNGVWQTVTRNGTPVQSGLTTGGAFLLHVNPTVKGALQYRVASGSVHSSPITVTVT